MVLILVKIRFQVRCLRVALWNSLNLWEIFGLSITICSAQFTFLKPVLHRNKTTRQTIVSHTIICHYIFVFLTNVWKRAPQSAKENPRNLRKFDLLSTIVWQVFSWDESAKTLHKASENRTCKGVTLFCHTFLFCVFNAFTLKHLELNNKSLIGRLSV